jgi:hypothetical protein
LAKDCRHLLVDIQNGRQDNERCCQGYFMKRPPQPHEIPAALSHAMHKLLNSYALAASAAGVSMLALAQPAAARVVYTPVHIRFGRNTEVMVDLNHGRATDFYLINNFSNFGNRNSYRFFVSAYHQPNSIQGKKDASALKVGDRIGPKQSFSHNASLMAHFYTSSGQVLTSSGLWKNVKDRYLGLKFLIKGKTHYGWARLSVTVHRGSTYGISAVLTGYAYETVPNKSIIAGETKGSDVITLAPGTLGHLAKGTSAISAWGRDEG